MIDQLRRPEDKRQEVVIVQSPDPMRPGGLQAVLQLQLPHEVDVVDEDAEDEGRVVVLLDEAEAREAEEEGG